MDKDLSQIHRIRSEYIKAELLEKSVSDDAILQFSNWFNEALTANVIEPNAMTLATATATGMVDARIVLLKEIDENGFVFFTNYNSKKGKDIVENNQVALLFFWPELERQVRIQGIAEKIPFAQSEKYFRSRPVGSQLGALASQQSAVIESRATIEKKILELKNTFKNQDIPAPDFWGGYKVTPTQMEFWQGRANRLHDRLVYSKTLEGWKLYRISP